MASPFELIEGVKRSRLVCVVANTAERKNEKKVVAIQPFSFIESSLVLISWQR